MNYRMLSFFRRMVRNTTSEQLLFLCWFAGSSLGFSAARFCGDAFASFLVLLPGQLPDWGGVFASAMLPLLLSAIAVFLFQAAGCFLSCLIRGLCQGALVCMIGSGYGSGAPLMTVLLLFSSWLLNPVMLLYWLRCLEGEFSTHLGDTAAAALLCGLVGAADRGLIAPFLLDVINFSM